MYRVWNIWRCQQILIGLSVNVDISTSKVNNVYFLIFRVEYISENIFACFLTFLCKNNAKKSYLKIGEFIVLYVRKGQTSEIVFVLNTPNGWLFTNKVYHLLLLMNKLGRETNELESLDNKREDGHQPNKTNFITNLLSRFLGEVYGIYEKITQINRHSVITRKTVKLNMS